MSATVILAGKRCFFDDDYLAFARVIMEMKSELVPLRRSLNRRTSFGSENSIEKISQASVWTSQLVYSIPYEHKNRRI